MNNEKWIIQKENPADYSTGFSFWQRMRDSNPRERSQSPVCYRYTNPLSICLWHSCCLVATWCIILRFRKMSSTFGLSHDKPFESTHPHKTKQPILSDELSHFESFESHAHSKRKKPNLSVELFLLAEDEGFEPPRTESESGVLPLH